MAKAAQKPSELEEFVNYTKELEIAFQAVENAEHSAKDVKEKAEKEIAKYALEAMKAIDPTVNSVDGLSNDVIQGSMQLYISMKREKAAGVLYNGASAVLAKISDKGLEKILGSQEFMENSHSQKYADLYSRYNGVRSMKDFMDRAKTGKLKDDERDSLTQLAARGYGETKKAQFKKDGYSGAVQSLAQDIATKLVLAGKIKLGNDILAKSLEPQYNSLLADFNAYETSKGKKVYDAVRENVVSMVKGNRRDFDLASGLIYRAAA